MTTSSTPEAATAAPCPRCGAATNGRFCAECGTAVTDARCRRCHSGLSTGARFCHRCGTPATEPGRVPLVANTTLPTVAAVNGDNVFAVLMDAARVCSLQQVTEAFFEVGGQYRRNV